MSDIEDSPAAPNSPAKPKGKPGRPKKKGRKTKFTRDTRAKIIRHLLDGNSRKDSAMLAGISQTLLIEWLNKGRENKGPVFVTFFKSVEAAEAQYRSTLVKVVKVGAEEDPELAIKVLRVKDPENWAERQKVDVQHGGSIKIVLEDDD